MSIILVDTVKYRLWTPKDEEKDFHPMVREHFKEIFGKNSVYFDVKRVLKTASGIGSIPDAYVINMSKPYEFYVVENELSTHPIYDHVVRQLTKFINGIENQNAKSEIIDILYDEINEDIVLRATFQKLVDSGDVYHFLSKLLSQPPRIVIIIDKKTSEIEEACRVLKYHTDIVEFKTFARENAESVRAHLFEPLRPEKPPVKGGGIIIVSTKPGEITPQPEYALPILESIIEFGGGAKVPDVLNKVYEKMKDKLREKDREPLPTGAIRWKNHAMWERQALKNDGYLRKNSARGMWEITDEGRKFCETLKSKKPTQ